MGQIQVKLGFNQTKQEIYVDVLKVEHVKVRLNADISNFNVAFRVFDFLSYFEPHINMEQCHIGSAKLDSCARGDSHLL